MKKNNLAKILLITFAVAILLSWIIPVSEYESGSLTLGSITPIGIFDLALVPLTVFDIALSNIIFILIVGAFYGVLNKTGVYSKLVETFTKKIKGKETRFLVLNTVILGLLSALTGLNFMFFFIIPFIATLMLSVGFGKITTMLSTLGSILVGMIGSIYGSDISYYINVYIGYNSDYSYNTSIFPDKIILLFLILFLLVMYVLKLGKKDLIESSKKKNEEIKEIPLYTKTEKSKRSWKPLFIIMVVTFVIMVVGFIKWDNIIGTTANPSPFLDFYEKMTEIKINGFSIISAILGTVPAFGYWTLAFASVLVLFVTILISIIYKLKFDEMAEGFIEGVKENIRIAFYIIGANLVFAVLFKNGATANFVTTIINYLMNLTENFSSAMLSLTTIIASFFYNNFATLVGTLYTPTVILTGTTVELRFLAGLIIQTLYGLVMLIAPTSVLLVTGLSYFKIPYKDWFKNVWKLLLQLFIVIALIIVIVTIFSM